MKRKSMILAVVLLMVMVAPLWAQNENYFEVKQNADGGITITGFNDTGKVFFRGPELVIPSTLYGTRVTAISDNAFGYYNDRIRKFTSVVIPDTVTSIGNGAFRGSWACKRYPGERRKNHWKKGFCG